MKKTVGELEQTLGAWELAEWKQMAHEMPIGAKRDNLHAGVIAMTLNNLHVKKGEKGMTPNDFLLVPVKDKIKTGVASAFASLMAMAVPKKVKKRKKVKK